jgi:membrane dipeptidase
VKALPTCTLKEDPQAWAHALGISQEAVDLYLRSDVLDLHIDSFLWHRIFRYDLTKAHGPSWLPGVFWSQVDFPRIRQAAITGATWVFTTNPAVAAAERPRRLLENLHTFERLLESVSEHFAIVRSEAEYQQCKQQGKHGIFLGIQGGNALDFRHDSLDLRPDGVILRITLVHMHSSKLGGTSFPLGQQGQTGLNPFGKDFVRHMNHKRIFVDLSHCDRKTFFDTVAIHHKDKPFLITHTGVSGVYPHWRNVDDEQLRAVAAFGGTVGIIFHSAYLGDPLWRGNSSSIVDHLAHIIRTVGEDYASLGSDWDGFIVTPRDMPTCLELPRLVQRMLDRRWQPERIQKILGGNFLRVVKALRG